MMFTHTRKLTATAIVFGFLLFVAVLPAFANGTGAAIEIPSIGVSAPIVNAPFSHSAGTWDVSALHWTVGHLQGTSFFGQGGNIALGAHSIAMDGTADVFRNLNQVAVGDMIFVTVNGQHLQYQVVETKNVSRLDTSIMRPTMDNRLTIFTCDPHSQSGAEYTRRDVVIAVPVG